MTYLFNIKFPVVATLLLLAATAAFTISCKKYLDVKPNNSLATASTLSDLQALLDNSDNMNEESTPAYGEAVSDDYFMLQGSYDQMRSQEQDAYIWKYNNNNNQNDWRNCYRPIYTANFCLDVLKEISKTSSNSQEWDRIKGTALFFRAHYFLWLAWTYSKAYDNGSADSDLGIVLRLNSDFDILSVRSNVRQTYTQIIDDVKESSYLLPDISIHPLRPSKAASYGLLARTYLSMRQYDSALKYADLCLSIKDELMDYNGDIDIVSNINDIAPPFKKYNKEIIFYTEMATHYSSISSTYARIDSVLYESYSSDDLRKAAFFSTAGLYQKFKGNYSQSISLPFFSGIATDEIILIRAECYARNGNILDALMDLNGLLSKRWKRNSFSPVATTTPEETVRVVLEERRKELLIRGLRWSDIKRLNKEGANITLKRYVNNQFYTLMPNDDRYALLIPKQIIDITGMPQNSGW